MNDDQVLLVRCRTTKDGDQFSLNTIKALFPLIEGRPYDGMYGSTSGQRLTVTLRDGTQRTGIVSLAQYGIGIDEHPDDNDHHPLAYRPHQVRSIEVFIPTICADCDQEIDPTDALVIVLSLTGDGTEHLHVACKQARCGYCSGRGWTKPTYNATEGPTCVRCGGTGRSQDDG